jgi:hypothetical protein
LALHQDIQSFTIDALLIKLQPHADQV